MARIRSIKPEFWTDPEVAACSIPARLFFIGVWNFADDYGVVKDDPDRLRLQIMPSDTDVDATALVDELVERNLLLRREAEDGTKVLVVRTFCVHQRIDRRTIGRYGDPAQFRAIPRDPAHSPQVPRTPHPGGERKGGEGKQKTDSSSEPPEPTTDLVLVTASPAATIDPIRSVFEAWQEATGHNRARLDPKRRKLIAAALKSYPPGDVRDAVTGWRHSPFHRGENDQRTLYNGLELLLRDAAHIEQFRDLERGEACVRAGPSVPDAWAAIAVLDGRR